MLRNKKEKKSCPDMPLLLRDDVKKFSAWPRASSSPQPYLS
jgi:hypothetical protein